MPDAITENMFYSLNITAWHKLGEVGQVGETATSVASRMPIPQAQLMPLKGTFNRKVVKSGWSNVIIPNRDANLPPYIVGHPVNADQYNLITHQDAIALFDKYVRDEDGNTVDVETLGVLGEHGERLFITTKLPSYEVKGDPMDSYLFLYNTVIPGHVAWAVETDIRVVCQNTAQAALARALQRFAIPHSEGAKKRMGTHLKDIYATRLVTQGIIREAYELMAATPVTEVQVAEIAEHVYRFPQKPDPARLTKATYSERQRRYDLRMDWVEKMRTGITAAFQGAGIGLTDNPLAGTCWTGWHAFTEQESHRNGKDTTIARELLDGERGNNIRHAHRLFMAIAQPAKANDWRTEAAQYASAD